MDGASITDEYCDIFSPNNGGDAGGLTSSNLKTLYGERDTVYMKVETLSRGDIAVMQKREEILLDNTTQEKTKTWRAKFEQAHEDNVQAKPEKMK
jgi:hypothetical protein